MILQLMTKLTTHKALCLFLSMFGFFANSYALSGPAWDRGDFFEAKCVQTDHDGNILLGGIFSGTYDFDPGVDILERSSGEGIAMFIYKLSEKGELLWLDIFPGELRKNGHSFDVEMKIGADNSIYLTGNLLGELDFDPGEGACKLFSEDGSWNSYNSAVFHLKLDATGTFQWARLFGGTHHGTSVDRVDFDLDAEGNLFVLGSFRGIVGFDLEAGKYNLISKETDRSWRKEYYISKMDATGKWLWARKLLYDEVFSMAITKEGKILLNGFANKVSDMDPGEDIYYVSRNDESIKYLTQLDTSFTYEWTRVFNCPLTGKKVKNHGLSIDASQNVYLLGECSTSVEYEPEFMAQKATAEEGDNRFLAKIDRKGQLSWMFAMQGPNERFMNFHLETKVNAAGMIGILGEFSDTVVIAQSKQGGLVPPAKFSLLIAQFESSGKLRWVQTLATIPKQKLRMTIDEAGNIIVVANLIGTDEQGVKFKQLSDLPHEEGTLVLFKFDVKGNVSFATPIGTSQK